MMSMMRLLRLLTQIVSSSSFLIGDYHGTATPPPPIRLMGRLSQSTSSEQQPSGLVLLSKSSSSHHPCDESVSEGANTGRRKALASMVSLGLVIGVSPVFAPSPALAAAASANTDQMKQVQVATNKRIGGLASKIRSVCNVMDELQRDLMQVRWDLVAGYPSQLRSYVPVFTTYTDSAFPSDAPTDWGLRVALRYEIGRFFAALERFRQAASRQALEEAYLAYSEMSLHLDRYLRVGGLYTYYDDTVSTEPYFEGIKDTELVYDKKERPSVRDLVVFVNGPDKGKTGIMIGQYMDGSKKCVVKLDRFKGMREIRVVQDSWVAKRLGEQDPDDVFLIPRRG